MKALWLAFKKRHWDGRAPKERRAIILGSLILSPIIAYFLLWQPAHLANAKLRAVVPDLRAQAAHLRSQVAEAESVRHLPHSTVLDANALKTAIEESAVRHHIRNAISSIETQPPDIVRLTLASVSFEQWLDWLRSLQQEQHIRVESTGIAPLPQSGIVKINATLTNGGTE
jgi:type II secretory pathway component PulM